MSFDPRNLQALSDLERSQWLAGGGTGWWMPSFAWDPRSGNLLYRQGDAYRPVSAEDSAAINDALLTGGSLRLASAMGSGGVGEQPASAQGGESPPASKLPLLLLGAMFLLGRKKGR